MWAQITGNYEYIQRVHDASSSRSLAAMYPDGPQISHRLQFHFDRHQGSCADCRSSRLTSKLRGVTTLTYIPDVLIVSIGIDNLDIEGQLNFRRSSGDVKLNMSGLAGHFPSLIVDREGSLWYHDGMTTHRSCQYKGKIKDDEAHP